MLIKYKGKLFREVRAVKKPTFADGETKRSAIKKVLVRKKTFADAKELTGDELVEYIDEVKNNQARNFVRAINDIVTDTLTSLQKERKLNFRDIDTAIGNAVSSFVKSPSGAITDF